MQQRKKSFEYLLASCLALSFWMESKGNFVPSEGNLLGWDKMRESMTEDSYSEQINKYNR